MGGKGSKRRDVDEVVKDNFDKLASIPGVTAVDSGEQIKGGKETNKKVIKVYVEEKKSKNDLQDSEKIPQKIEGHKVDVEEGKGHILGVGKEFLVEWREGKPVGANLPKPYHGPEQVSEVSDKTLPEASVEYYPKCMYMYYTQSNLKLVIINNI